MYGLTVAVLLMLASSFQASANTTGGDDSVEGDASAAEAHDATGAEEEDEANVSADSKMEVGDGDSKTEATHWSELDPKSMKVSRCGDAGLVPLQA
jgi:hypothetical protein